MRGEVHILVYCPIDTLQWGSTHSAMVKVLRKRFSLTQQPLCSFWDNETTIRSIDDLLKFCTNYDMKKVLDHRIYHCSCNTLFRSIDTFRSFFYRVMLLFWSSLEEPPPTAIVSEIKGHFHKGLFHWGPDKKSTWMCVTL